MWRKIAIIIFISPCVFQSNLASAQEKTVLLNVPFTPQAPFAEWSDARQEDGCEEAAALMAVHWAEGKTITRAEAKKEILAMADYETRRFKNFHDTSAADTVARLFKGYFKYDLAEVKSLASVQDVVSELRAGHLVIVPTNGRALKNPYYKQPGPERHMLIIRGFDPEKKEFIVNDSGTKRGEKYRYPYQILFNAIRDYPTGNKVKITGAKKVMIVVSK